MISLLAMLERAVSRYLVDGFGMDEMGVEICGSLFIDDGMMVTSLFCLFVSDSIIMKSVQLQLVSGPSWAPPRLVWFSAVA